LEQYGDVDCDDNPERDANSNLNRYQYAFNDAFGDRELDLDGEPDLNRNVDASVNRDSD